MRDPELEVGVAGDATDPKAEALNRLTTYKSNLDVSLSVIDAIEGRIKLRPPIPTPPTQESLQNLVRRGRRRLERERQSAARGLHDTRLDVVTKLRTVLES
jgi:hypothetical protein